MAGWKALLVDDEAEFVSTLAERLELRGIEAIVANDGQEALSLVEREKPRVIVLDIMMPRLGGLDVLKILKETHPEIEVILLTGRGTTKEGIEGMKLGAFDFLIKPIRIEELLPRMIRAAEKSGDREEGSDA